MLDAYALVYCWLVRLIPVTRTNTFNLAFCGWQNDSGSGSIGATVGSITAFSIQYNDAQHRYTECDSSTISQLLTGVFADDNAANYENVNVP